MVRYFFRNLIWSFIVFGSYLPAQTSDIQTAADICDCSATIECREQEQVTLSLRTRKSFCHKYLSQQVTQLSSNNFLDCDQAVLPNVVDEISVSECERRSLEVIHCKDRREGQKICNKIDRPGVVCNELSCSFTMKSLTDDIKRLHQLVSYLNKPAKVSLTQNGKKNVLSGLASDDHPYLDQPIEVPIAPEPELLLQKPKDKYIFITQEVGTKAAKFAAKMCKEVNSINSSPSTLLKAYFKSLLLELVFLQKESLLATVIDCSDQLDPT